VNRAEGGYLAGRYDRQFLLFGVKRNSVLALEEVRLYGIDTARDPDYVSVYGMPPSDWYALGVRMLGRTAVECTRDALAAAIAVDVAAVAGAGRFPTAPVLVDPFVGSGNTLLDRAPRSCLTGVGVRGRPGCVPADEAESGPGLIRA
jgi:hypothetical protein